MSGFKVPNDSPWGEVQGVEFWGDGILLVHTASHGGFFLSEERNARMPKRYREFAEKWSHGWGDRWYEEDSAALAVFVTFPEEFGLGEHDQRYAIYLDTLESRFG